MIKRTRALCITSALALAGLGGAAVPAAQADSSCPQGTPGVYYSGLYFDNVGNTGTRACVSPVHFIGFSPGDPVPIIWTTTPGGSVTAASGGLGSNANYVVIDGAPGTGDPSLSSFLFGMNNNPGATSGYIGVDNGDPSGADPEIVFCDEGDYDPAGSNHAILSLSGKTPDPSDSCMDGIAAP